MKDRVLIWAAIVGFILFAIGSWVNLSSNDLVTTEIRNVDLNNDAKITANEENRIVEIHKPSKPASLVSTILLSLGAAILFPVLVSFAYDYYRERSLGDEVWRLFADLNDAGIARVYKDREFEEGRDNARTRLEQEFLSFKKGEIRMMGPTLRVFFSPTGEFYKSITKMLTDSLDSLRMRVLIEQDNSPCVADRTEAEQDNLGPNQQPRTLIDTTSTVNAIIDINSTTATANKIDLKRFRQAPYCTAIIFPHIAYYSPNLLSKPVPIRLPMILFRRGSHGYKVLENSFEYLWNYRDTQDAVPKATTSSQNKERTDEQV